MLCMLWSLYAQRKAVVEAAEVEDYDYEDLGSYLFFDEESGEYMTVDELVERDQERLKEERGY